MAYDDSNIFAKILRGELPCNKVYEDEYTLAFHDIDPQAPVHVLVIPKGKYISFDDFSATAPDEELLGFDRAVGQITRELGLADAGYRILANHGEAAGQFVPHYHLHIFGGGDLGAMIAKS
jgi:histidine triad (HIT) family protein